MDADLLVIGGGINGVGTAADAAGRGLSVILCEKGDLASGTSSASSNLIHGGLRYLEHGQFGLVRQALHERNLLSKHASHLITAQPFLLPMSPEIRKPWLLRLGLKIYDFLAWDSQLPKSSSIVIKDLGLQAQYHHALKYYDCKVDDSRLVLHVALQAHEHGAHIFTRTEIIAAERTPKHWIVKLKNGNEIRDYVVKAIVNAAGPSAQQIANNILHVHTEHKIRLIKGTHILVPKLFDHNEALVLQNNDQRTIFVIPYMDKFSLIGTTEVLVDDPKDPVASEEEIEYLCNAVNKFILNPIKKVDIVHVYAGIRPLYNDDNQDPSKNSREFVIDIDDKQAPLITLFGGKLTTYRHTSEQICNTLQKNLPKCGAPWTDTAYLPGGHFPNNDQDMFKKHIKNIYTHLPQDLLQHYLNNYGTRITNLLMNVHSQANLGEHFGGFLYKREVDFLMQHEWARTAEDILWRRGKQGLFLDDQQVSRLSQYLDSCHK